MRQTHWTALAITLCCAFVGCDDVVMVLNPGAPSLFRNELEFVHVHPDVLFVAPSVPYTCPGVPPYSIGFTLNVQAGQSAVTVRQVSYHATDVNGLASAPVVVSGDALRSRFGTVTVSRHGVAAYPFTYTYGCGRSVKLATLHSRIETVDEAGEPRSTTVEVPVR